MEPMEICKICWGSKLSDFYIRAAGQIKALSKDEKTAVFNILSEDHVIELDYTVDQLSFLHNCIVECAIWNADTQSVDVWVDYPAQGYSKYVDIIQNNRYRLINAAKYTGLVQPTVAAFLSSFILQCAATTNSELNFCKPILVSVVLNDISIIHKKDEREVKSEFGLDPLLQSAVHEVFVKNNTIVIDIVDENHFFDPIPEKRMDILKRQNELLHSEEPKPIFETLSGLYLSTIITYIRQSFNSDSLQLRAYDAKTGAAMDIKALVKAYNDPQTRFSHALIKKHPDYALDDNTFEISIYFLKKGRLYALHKRKPRLL